MKRLLYLLLSLYAASCSLNDEALLPGHGEVTVSFNICSPGTRGFVSDHVMDESRVDELKIAIYDPSGILFHEMYYEGLDDGCFEATLYSGMDYTLFALANMGNVDVPEEMSALQSYSYSCPLLSAVEDKGSLPMSAEMPFNPSGGGAYVIALEKLVAEIMLKVETPDGFSFDIGEVSLHSVPASVTPFSGSGGGERVEGDHSTGDDCIRIDGGDSVGLYIYEDMSSGREFPPASSVPEEKEIPEGIPYISVSGTLSGSACLEYAVLRYNVLLDYNLERNRKYAVTLAVTEQGMFEDSYRVEVTDAVLRLSESYKVLWTGYPDFLYCEASMYDDVEYESSKPDVVYVDRYTGYMAGMKKGSAVVTAYSPALGAGAECKVDVYNQSDDYVSFNNPGLNIFLAKPVDVYFNSLFGGEISLVSRDGTVQETLMLDVSRSDGLKKVENRYLVAEFDPESYGSGMTGRMNVTFKRKCSLDMKLISPFGKEASLTRSPRVPELVLSVDRKSIKEDEYTTFKASMVDMFGNELKRDDFAGELFDSVYGGLSVMVDESCRNSADIWEYDNVSGTGILAALDAGNGGAKVKMGVSYLAIGDNADPDAAEVSVMPVFGNVPASMGQVENRIMLTSDGMYSKLFQSFAGMDDLPESEILVRHLGWDRDWDTGTACSGSELSASCKESGSWRSLTLDFGIDGCGPYAVRFVRRNPLTGREYYRQTELDVHLMLECGPYVEWVESNQYKCDVKMIWNLHPVSAGSSIIKDFPQSRDEPYIHFSYTGYTGSDVPAMTYLYRIGQIIYDWVPESRFHEIESESYQADRCEVYMAGISNYALNLYDPFRNERRYDGFFYTDEAFAEKYYQGRPYLFGVTLNQGQKILLSIKHNCTSSGYESDLYGRNHL